MIGKRDEGYGRARGGKLSERRRCRERVLLIFFSLLFFCSKTSIFLHGSPTSQSERPCRSTKATSGPHERDGRSLLHEALPYYTCSDSPTTLQGTSLTFSDLPLPSLPFPSPLLPLLILVSAFVRRDRLRT